MRGAGRRAQENSVKLRENSVKHRGYKIGKYKLPIKYKRN
jgi:hypothetical protein